MPFARPTGLVVQRRARDVFPAIARHVPARGDEALARADAARQLGLHLAQQDDAPFGLGERERAGAIERGPEERVVDVAPRVVDEGGVGDEGRREAVGVGPRAGKDPQAVARRPLEAADEALREDQLVEAPEGRSGLLRCGEVRRRRDVEVELDPPRAGDLLVAVPQHALGALGHDVERLLERGRRVEPDGRRARAVEGRGESTGHVAAVARSGRTAEASRDLEPGDAGRLGRHNRMSPFRIRSWVPASSGT